MCDCSMDQLKFPLAGSRNQRLVILCLVVLLLANLQPIDCASSGSAQKKSVDKRYAKPSVPFSWIRWRIGHQRTIFTNNESVRRGLSFEQMARVKTTIDLKKDGPAILRLVRQQKQLRRQTGTCLFNVVSCFGRSTLKSRKPP